MEFEWDENKNNQNKEKHKISFELAAGFFDIHPFTEDVILRNGENRVIRLVKVRDIWYFVVYIPRNNKIRIISAQGQMNMNGKDTTYTIEQIRQIAANHQGEFADLESMPQAQIEINALDDYKENLADDKGFVNFQNGPVHVNELEIRMIRSFVPIELEIQQAIMARNHDVSVYVNNILRQHIQENRV